MSKNVKIVKTLQLKIIGFTALKNHCILHRHVFVMCVFLWSICLVTVKYDTFALALLYLTLYDVEDVTDHYFLLTTSEHRL